MSHLKKAIQLIPTIQYHLAVGGLSHALKAKEYEEVALEGVVKNETKPTGFHDFFPLLPYLVGNSNAHIKRNIFIVN